MAKSLTSRKQEFVRDSIYDAAIDLFVRQGFDESSIDDVARAAGVSRRSFFRYFGTKDHLLGHNIVRHGDVLVAAVTACPAESSANQVVHDAVFAGMGFAMTHPRTRQIIEISSKHPSARQAHASRRVDVEIRLARAFAARTRNQTENDVRPRMLAILTLTVVDLAIFSWFKGEFEDGLKAADNVFAMMSHVLHEPVETHASRPSSTPAPKAKKTAVKRRKQAVR